VSLFVWYVPRNFSLICYSNIIRIVQKLTFLLCNFLCSFTTSPVLVHMFPDHNHAEWTQPSDTCRNFELFLSVYTRCVRCYVWALTSVSYMCFAYFTEHSQVPRLKRRLQTKYGNFQIHWAVGGLLKVKNARKDVKQGKRTPDQVCDPTYITQCCLILRKNVLNCCGMNRLMKFTQTDRHLCIFGIINARRLQWNARVSKVQKWNACRIFVVNPLVDIAS
jgi:hypothetical protein